MIQPDRYEVMDQIEARIIGASDWSDARIALLTPPTRRLIRLLRFHMLVGDGGFAFFAESDRFGHELIHDLAELGLGELSLIVAKFFRAFTLQEYSSWSLRMKILSRIKGIRAMDRRTMVLLPQLIECVSAWARRTFDRVGGWEFEPGGATRQMISRIEGCIHPVYRTYSDRFHPLMGRLCWMLHIMARIEASCGGGRGADQLDEFLHEAVTVQFLRDEALIKSAGSDRVLCVAPYSLSGGHLAPSDSQL